MLKENEILEKKAVFARLEVEATKKYITESVHSSVSNLKETEQVVVLLELRAVKLELESEKSFILSTVIKETDIFSTEVYMSIVDLQADIYKKEEDLKNSEVNMLQAEEVDASLNIFSSKPIEKDIISIEISENLVELVELKLKSEDFLLEKIELELVEFPRIIEEAKIELLRYSEEAKIELLAEAKENDDLLGDIAISLATHGSVENYEAYEAEELDKFEILDDVYLEEDTDDHHE